MGGTGSKLRTVALNTDYSFYVVVSEEDGEIAVLHYLKNVEVTALPDGARMNKVDE